MIAKPSDSKPSDAGSPDPADGRPGGELLRSLLADHPDGAQRATTRDGYAVELRADAAHGPEQMRLLGPNGQLCLTITLAADGPRVEVHGVSLHVRAEQHMRFEAPRIELAASQAITLSSGGTIEQRAAGLVKSVGFEHDIEATHGEVRLRANDDVAIDGERIRLNSPSEPLPPHVRTNRPPPALATKPPTTSGPGEDR